jgi:hypothetical protein
MNRKQKIAAAHMVTKQALWGFGDTQVDNKTIAGASPASQNKYSDGTTYKYTTNYNPATKSYDVTDNSANQPFMERHGGLKGMATGAKNWVGENWTDLAGADLAMGGIGGIGKGLAAGYRGVTDNWSPAAMEAAAARKKTLNPLPLGEDWRNVATGFGIDQASIQQGGDGFMPAQTRGTLNGVNSAANMFKGQMNAWEDTNLGKYLPHKMFSR